MACLVWGCSLTFSLNLKVSWYSIADLKPSLLAAYLCPDLAHTGSLICVLLVALKHFPTITNPFCEFETSSVANSYEVLNHGDSILFIGRALQKVIHIEDKGVWWARSLWTLLHSQTQLVMFPSLDGTPYGEVYNTLFPHVVPTDVVALLQHNFC